MLRLFSNHQLTTDHWINLIKGLTLYELCTYKNVRTNAREACDLELLNQRGAVACELQKQRLNHLLFDSSAAIGAIKADDAKKMKWSEAVMGCLTDVNSGPTHRLSCLIFLGALFDLDPLDVLEQPEQGLTCEILLETEENDTLLLLYAKVFPVRVFKIIESFLSFESNNSLADCGTLFRRLGSIYFAVDDQTRVSIVIAIELRLVPIVHAEKLDDLYNDFFPAICDTLIHIRYCVTPEKRKDFIRLLETLIQKHDNHHQDRMLVIYAKKTIATLKGVDNPDDLSRYIGEELQRNPLYETEPCWLVDNASDLQITMILNAIKKIFLDGLAPNTAIRYLNLIAYRLKQEELINIAKMVIDIYDRENRFFETNEVLPKLLEHMTDDEIEIVYRYVKEKNIDSKQVIKEWILIHASTAFIKKIADDLKLENVVWLRSICVKRIILCGNDITDDGCKLLLHVFTDGEPNEYEMAALSVNIKKIEPLLQQQFINVWLAECNDKHNETDMILLVTGYVIPLIHCLSIMKNEEEINSFKKICEKVMNSNVGRFLFTQKLIQAITRLDENSRLFIKSLNLNVTTEKILIHHAIECIDTLERAKHSTEEVVTNSTGTSN